MQLTIAELGLRLRSSRAGDDVSVLDHPLLGTSRPTCRCRQTAPRHPRAAHRADPNPSTLGSAHSTPLRYSRACRPVMRRQINRPPTSTAQVVCCFVTVRLLGVVHQREKLSVGERCAGPGRVQASHHNAQSAPRRRLTAARRFRCVVGVLSEFPRSSGRIHPMAQDQKRKRQTEHGQRPVEAHGRQTDGGVQQN